MILAVKIIATCIMGIIELANLYSIVDEVEKSRFWVKIVWFLLVAIPIVAIWL